jgi:signal recognition particle GTPase
VAEIAKTFDDIRELLEKIRLGQVVVPAWVNAIFARNRRDVLRLCGIIDAMTPDERRNFARTINLSRRRRIAAGAGVNLSEIRQCDTFAAAMKSLGRADRRG